MPKKEKPITRKDFIKKSCAGITGLFAYDVLKKNPLKLFNLEGSSLETRVLGRTGIKVTKLGYGASRSMEPALLLAAIDNGINFIDSGRAYFNGNNEVMIGKTLKGIRKNVVLQSKMRIRLRESDKSGNLSEAITKIMDSSLNASLKALQTDYIDIMLIHDLYDVEIMNHDAVLEFFTSAKKQGKIRACGFSVHNVTEMVEVLRSANQSKFYDIIMLPYNYKGSYVHMLSGNSSEWDQPLMEVELKKAHKSNIATIAMKTCSAGPYSPGNNVEPSFKEAIEWVLKREFIYTAAVAMSNMGQIEANVKAVR